MLFWYFSAEWRLIYLIRWTFNVWFCLPRRSFADQAGGKVDLSDNVNAPAPSGWKCDQDALTFSSVSEMCPMAVICFFWAWDAFCVACRFWLPCHISKRSGTLAILCSVLSSTSSVISKSISVCVLTNDWSSPAKIRLLPRANFLTTTSSQTVSSVVFDCFQLMISRARERPASTQIPCCMIEQKTCAILER